MAPSGEEKSTIFIIAHTNSRTFSRTFKIPGLFKDRNYHLASVMTYQYREYILYTIKKCLKETELCKWQLTERARCMFHMCYAELEQEFDNK